jgi:hypothetical protein
MLVRNLITGSTPPILHRNGDPAEWRERWPQIVADFFDESQQPCDASVDLTVLTWNNRQTKTLLERCLDRWSVPYVVLGEDLPKWRPDMKVYLNAEALASVRTEYVLALDADDVLVVSPLEDVVAAFQAFECDIVFSGEKNSYPEVPYIEEFERSIADSLYCHLNSGAWIGKTTACLRFFRDCLEEHRHDLLAAQPSLHVLRDDQGVTRKTFRRYYPATKLDYHCRLFQSLFDVSPEGEVLITPHRDSSRC